MVEIEEYRELEEDVIEELEDEVDMIELVLLLNLIG